MDSVIKDAAQCYDQMLIIEKYERVINYLYPIALNLPNKHKNAKDLFINVLFEQVRLFNEAGKTNQVGKLYLADSGLSNLRFWLRFFVNYKIKGITEHQKLTAEALLAEVGALLGSWIKKIQSLRKG